MSEAVLHNGDCLDVMRGMPDSSVDLVLTDPPYGLKFMGKKWDCEVPSIDIWAEALRVLKPGGHLLAFAGTRTQHRMAVNIEDAGFEIRDMLAWVYGSGFPKSLDVSKAIDQAAGAEREVVGIGDARRASQSQPFGQGGKQAAEIDTRAITAPATPSAIEWQGWGTALKPALEPITMARKPLIGTVAANVLEHGTGALNIDACRVGTDDGYTTNCVTQGINTARTSYAPAVARRTFAPSSQGRWPANLIHDGSDEVRALFPVTWKSSARQRVLQHSGKHGGICDGGNLAPGTNSVRGHDDNGGSAARFFYCAKASKAERGKGNNHPTVKPIALMTHLAELACPPGATVLDPFMGSGTTGIACADTGRKFIGIEMDPEYFKIAEARINNSTQQLTLEI